MDNRIAIIDYTTKGDSIYVELEVFDAEKNKLHREEVRFLGDMLYGDFIHPERSALSEECRHQTVHYLKQYFNR